MGLKKLFIISEEEKRIKQELKKVDKKIEKVNQKSEKLNEKDVGYIEDLLTTLINLLHAEWHSTKSYMITKDEEWLRISQELRNDRSDLLEKVTKKDNSEIWCINKHLLISIGGYIELSNRETALGNKEKAIEYLDIASKWLGVFLVKNKIQ